MQLYIVSHNGLGDNLFMIGGINYIKQFYKNVFFICKSKYYNNVKLFFSKSSNVTCLPINENNEYNSIQNILLEKYNNPNNDIIACGVHKNYLKTKITNKKFLNHTLIDHNYTIDCSTINNNNYFFIENFYKDMKLNLTYFYEYFDIPSYKKSKELFDSVSKYYLIFIQLKSSCGKQLNIENLKKKYLYDDSALLICNDVNLYSINDPKYKLADKFIFNEIANYIDIIKNSDEIYLIDSCFTGIVLPLLKTNRLKTQKIEIILRDKVDNFML
jgi:hypothetical protein